jgi:hypothetical protein
MKDHTQRLAVLIALTALTALTYAVASSAEVYKTVDEDGNVIYTDQRPSPDAEPMDLPGLSVISAQRPQAGSPGARQAAEKPGEDGDVTMSLGDLKRGYRDFAIVSPIQDQVFTGMADMSFVAAWSTRNRLRNGMNVTVYFDGRKFPPTTEPTVGLGRLDRGTYELYAVLTDDRNRRIATAESVTFHVRRNSVLFQNRRRR